jgi:hypothetical protein
MAMDQSSGEAGHSCMAVNVSTDATYPKIGGCDLKPLDGEKKIHSPLARSDFACCMPPALSSILMLSAHNSSFLGLYSLALSNKLLALIVTPAFSSSRADRIQSGMLFEHDLQP